MDAYDDTEGCNVGLSQGFTFYLTVSIYVNKKHIMYTIYIRHVRTREIECKLFYDPSQKIHLCTHKDPCVQFTNVSL